MGTLNRLCIGVLCLLLASGCGGKSGSCTEVGCSSEIVWIPDLGKVGLPVELMLCVDSECASAVIERYGEGNVVRGDSRLGVESTDPSLEFTFALGEEVDHSGPHHVVGSVSIGGRELARVDRNVELERFEPNGPGCPPVCWRAVIETA